MKFMVLPLITFAILQALPLEPLAKKVIFMEMMTPLAVANVNLAALYRCKELVVTSLVFITTALFVPLLFVYTKIFDYLG